MLFALSYLAQDANPTFLNTQSSPLDIKNAETFCGRDWMNSEYVMDSLKRVVHQLDEKLSNLKKDETYDSTNSLILLYSYQYVYRIEFDGVASHQLCLEADSTHKRMQLTKNEKGILHDITSYENKYVTLTDTYYYLGNCQIWTTNKYYYIRADKYLEAY
jgi:hypothetical protein